MKMMNTNRVIGRASSSSSGRRASSSSRLICQASSVKLYTNPGSRGKICEWAIAELKMSSSAVEMVEVNMRAGNNKRREDVH